MLPSSRRSPRRRALTAGGLACLALSLLAPLPCRADLDIFLFWESEERLASRMASFGDIDMDGDLDIVVGNNTMQNQVYVNDGRGYYTLVWESGVMNATLAIALGDVDGDGDLDLACANDSQPETVYLNDGGMFQSTPIWMSDPQPDRPPMDPHDQSLAVAWGDVDLDGDLDLAVANFGLNRVYINDNGTLETTPSWSSGDGASSRDCAWADADGMPGLELACVNNSQQNAMYLNTGSALNTSAVWISNDTTDTRSCAWGDMDNDGDLDFAAAVFLGQNIIYENVGGPNILTLDPIWFSNDGERTRSISWGDWDGDGDQDMATANDGPPNRCYLNTGASMNQQHIWIQHETERYKTFAVRWGDIDNDGDLDLYSANLDQRNTMHLNFTGPVRRNANWSGNLSQDTRDVAWGDYDGDGDLDLAIANFGLANEIHASDGEELSRSTPWDSTDAANTHAIAWGDWDGDGDLELAVANDGQNQVFVNRSAQGDELEETATWTSAAPGSDSRDVAWADFDGDGDLDLAVANFGAPNAIYLNNGSGLPTTPDWVSDESDNSHGLDWGDFEGDGDLDLAVANDGFNRVYINDGRSLETTASWISSVAEDSRAVDWGDWNGDGDLDLAVANFGANRIHENDGTGLAVAASWASDETDDSTDVFWVDWAGDGFLDLSSATTNSGRTVVYRNDHGLDIETTASWTSWEDTNTNALDWADWNGDGDVEMARATDERNRVHTNAVVGDPESLPDTVTSPAVLRRPGSTDTANGFSSPERLTSPVTINYTLRDQQGDLARLLRMEYSLNGGGQWFPATEGPGSEGLRDLAADQNDVPHVFVWDAAADAASGNNVRFRVSVVYQSGQHVTDRTIKRPLIAAVSPVFAVFVDSDGDGIGDGQDNCPGISNPVQADGDSDGVGDDCDNCVMDGNPGQEDMDSDGAGDACDPCPGSAEGDADSDGACDDVDNCLGLANPSQADADSDGLGDDCDNCDDADNPDQADDDSDGVGNACDNCPTPNPTQADADSDGRGDECDNCPATDNPLQEDDDSDGTGNACDNCPQVASPSQADGDSDGVGDICDNCPATDNPMQEDDDSDGAGNACDNCPTPNPLQVDADSDGLGDDCDNCPADPNPGQEDMDSDGAGDACDQCIGGADDDLDDVCDDVDNCPGIANMDQSDIDSDGDGDACDDDADGDGAPNAADCAPLNPGDPVLAPEVMGLRVAKGRAGEAEMSWTGVPTGLEAGDGRYVLTSGELGALWADRDFSGACGIPGTLAEGVTDARALPAESGFYYLVQAENDCGVGPVGASSGGPDARLGLDWPTLPACP